MICKVCGKPIRRNAGAEEYDESKQIYTYTCKACYKLFRSLAIHPDTIDHHEQRSSNRRTAQ